MYPTKSTLDYMAEINRLFPRSAENDIFSSPALLNASAGRSSTSTDTSPESFSDVFGHQFRSEQHLQSPDRPNQSPARPDNRARLDRRLDYFDNPVESFQTQHMYETPSLSRCERPIVGRKIMTENMNHDENSNVRSEKTSMPHNMHINQIMYYELFPSDDKGTQNEKTASSFMGLKPSKICTNTANTSDQFAVTVANMSNYASSMSLWTDTMSDVSGFSSTPPSSFYPRSPESTISTHSRVPSRFLIKEPIMGPSTSLSTSGSMTICTFCRKNGETPLVFMTHKVKEKIGTKNIVTCPILRSHICSTCGASGDDAHTISYCPVVRSSNNGRRVQSTTVTLKNTRIKSNGRRRF